ncbi:MAG: 3D domain-containing protein [Clostridiaceae bacterium]
MLQKFIGGLKKNFKNGPLIIAMAVVIGIAVSLVIVGFRKTIVINIDGKEKQVVSFRGTVTEVLEDNKVILSPKDKTTPELDSEIEDGDMIKIKTAINVEVQVDGNDLKIQSAEDNVGDMLLAEEIEIRQDDKITSDIATPLYDGIVINITRVDTKIVEETEPISYATIVKSDDTMVRDTTKVTQEGVEGEKQITHSLVYEDGEVVTDTIISEETIKDPVDEIVMKGTLGVLNVASRGGALYYNDSFTVKATAYTAASCGKDPSSAGYGRTATGTYANRDESSYSTVAVDPNVIPYGTKLYIEGYGLAIAEDTGGAINGNRLDLYYNSLSDCYSWGVRYVKIYILK